MNRGERIAARHYRLRGYRILGTNVRIAGNELDLVVRRGRRLIFVEVKERARDGFGGGVGAVDAEKQRRVRRAAEAWLHAHPRLAAPDVRLEVVSITAGRLERVQFDPE